MAFEHFSYISHLYVVTTNLLIGFQSFDLIYEAKISWNGGVKYFVSRILYWICDETSSLLDRDGCFIKHLHSVVISVIGTSLLGHILWVIYYLWACIYLQHHPNPQQNFPTCLVESIPFIDRITCFGMLHPSIQTSVAGTCLLQYLLWVIIHDIGYIPSFILAYHPTYQNSLLPYLYCWIIFMIGCNV